MHVDPSQVLVVSDEAPEGIVASRKSDKKDAKPPVSPLRFPKVPPTKPMIERACAEFLAASRAQDRVILLFVGHTAVIDSQCYLAPLEGDLADKGTLISLSWLYEKLGQCKAQQEPSF